MQARWMVALGALALAACGGGPPPVANAVPADSTAVAMLDLEKLRLAPAYANLPAAARALVDPLAGVKLLAVAWNGTDLLLICGGFDQVPKGYIEIGKGIAAAGGAARIEAARKALATGRSAVNLPQGNAEIRAALRGDGKLPLIGNLANLSKLLRMSNTTTLLAHVEATVELEIASQCSSSEAAAQMEEALRAMTTLAAAGVRDEELKSALRDARITRENMLVRGQMIGKPEWISQGLGTP